MQRFHAPLSFLSVAALLVAYATLLSAPVGAQRRHRTSDVLDLASICSSEAGLHPSVDCAGIGYLLQRRARFLGISFRRMARAYSTRVFDRRNPTR